MNLHKRVYAHIDLDAITYNMEQMRQNLPEGTQMVGVIKMDGYGHGALPIAQILEPLDYVWGFATATLEEAAALKEEGIQKPVLVLGCIFEDQVEDMLEHDIRATVYMEEMAQYISKAAVAAGKIATVHIKIDTGMGRLGFPVKEESVDIIERISKLPNLKIEGVFTHFSKADEEDPEYTILQHDRFEWMKHALEERRIHVERYHCDNSAGIIEYPHYSHDMVRAGIALYGLYPSDEVGTDKVVLKPALELISHVTFVKEVEKGTKISYGGTFEADKKMKVATIPVGYGDGYARSLSNKGYVLIRGKRAKILGRICMDQFMVDVTDILDVAFGDRVILIGRDGEESIRVEDLSALCGRFNYEFVCDLNKRVPRIYIKNGEFFV